MGRRDISIILLQTSQNLYSSEHHIMTTYTSLPLEFIINLFFSLSEGMIIDKAHVLTMLLSE